MTTLIFHEDRCVMCGQVIPEGRMVCHNCEQKVMCPTEVTPFQIPTKNRFCHRISRKLTFGKVFLSKPASRYRKPALSCRQSTTASRYTLDSSTVNRALYRLKNSALR